MICSKTKGETTKSRWRSLWMSLYLSFLINFNAFRCNFQALGNRTSVIQKARVNTFKWYKQFFPILRANIKEGRFGKTTLQQNFVIEWMSFQFVWVIPNLTLISFFYYSFKYSNGSYLNKYKISKINDTVQSICSSYLTSNL